MGPRIWWSPRIRLGPRIMLGRRIRLGPGIRWGRLLLYTYIYNMCVVVVVFVVRILLADIVSRNAPQARKWWHTGHYNVLTSVAHGGHHINHYCILLVFESGVSSLKLMLLLIRDCAEMCPCCIKQHNRKTKQHASIATCMFLYYSMCLLQSPKNCSNIYM